MRKGRLGNEEGLGKNRGKVGNDTEWTIEGKEEMWNGTNMIMFGYKLG